MDKCLLLQQPSRSSNLAYLAANKWIYTYLKNKCALVFSLRSTAAKQLFLLSFSSHFLSLFIVDFLVKLSLKYTRLRQDMVSLVLKKRVSPNIAYNLHRVTLLHFEMKCSQQPKHQFWRVKVNLWCKRWPCWCWSCVWLHSALQDSDVSKVSCACQKLGAFQNSWQYCFYFLGGIEKCLVDTEVWKGF